MKENIKREFYKVNLYQSYSNPSSNYWKENHHLDKFKPHKHSQTFKVSLIVY